MVQEESVDAKLVLLSVLGPRTVEAQEVCLGDLRKS